MGRYDSIIAYLELQAANKAYVQTLQQGMPGFSVKLQKHYPLTISITKKGGN